MKAAVISGGGAAGAYTVGVVSRLQPDYDFISGTSTGALMAPSILLKQFDRLKTAYTNVTNKDIYSWEPFNSKGHVKLWNIVWRQLTQKNTLGDTTAMKKLIQQFFTLEDYLKIQDLGKEFVANLAETNYYPAKVVSVSSKQVSYREMVNAMWASSNVPFLMSQYKEGGNEFCDGGHLQLYSVEPAIKRGYKDIDLYIHRINKTPYYRGEIKDLLHNAQRTFAILTERLEYNCLIENTRLAHDYNATLNTNWLPGAINGSFLNFNTSIMKTWYELGYNM